jgi:hypothetical protein
VNEKLSRKVTSWKPASKSRERLFIPRIRHGRTLPKNSDSVSSNIGQFIRLCIDKASSVSIVARCLIKGAQHGTEARCKCGNERTTSRRS